jgi:hypothetical protein
MTALSPFREHDPERGTPVFRKDHAQAMEHIDIRSTLSQILPYRGANELDKG